MTEPAPRKSDLGIRVVSAVVMVAVAGTALWLGGWVWTAFVTVVALGVLWEWRALVVGFKTSTVVRGLWYGIALIYVGLAAFMLCILRFSGPGDNVVESLPVLMVVVTVIATDVGAYFVGRTVGGPKIAARISPSKTWSGLLGGMASASLALFLIGSLSGFVRDPYQILAYAVPLGAVGALVAQAGDFFESWMKRRAGVKDSGTVIPGHGGLFDRVDGLLAVLFLIGLFAIGTLLSHIASGGSWLPSPA